jgi:hypothetical protein
MIHCTRQTNWAHVPLGSSYIICICQRYYEIKRVQDERYAPRSKAGAIEFNPSPHYIYYKQVSPFGGFVQPPAQKSFSAMPPVVLMHVNRASSGRKRDAKRTGSGEADATAWWISSVVYPIYQFQNGLVLKSNLSSGYIPLYLMSVEPQ